MIIRDFNSEGRLFIHFFISDKINVVTTNKVASRYLGSLAQQGYFKEVSFTTDGEYNIKSNISIYSEETTKEEVLSEWDMMFSKKTTKDILFLYRSPIDRTITGIVQEFYEDVFDGVGRGNDFKLQMILENFVGGPSFYSKILLRPQWHNLNNEDWLPLFNENDFLILETLLASYLEKFSLSDIINRDHTSIYITYLYNLLISDRLDMNKVSIIEIEKNKKALENTLKLYFDLELVGVNKSSNSFLLKRLQSNKKYTKYGFYNKIIDKLKISLDSELFFYKKVLELPNNILDKKI